MVWHNLRLALRQVVRRPIATVVMTLTLGLGIGVNAALFSVADAVLLRPLPYPEPEKLVAVWEGRSDRDVDIPIADGNFFDLHRESQDFLQLAAHFCSETMVGVGPNRFRVETCGHTGEFFPVLGVAPALGTTSPADPASGQIGVTIGHRFWHRAFGGRDDILGQSMNILGYPMVVSGVMPTEFDFPKGADLWVNYEPFLGPSRTAHNLEAVARLRDGVSLETARSRMAAVAEGLMRQHGAEIQASEDSALTLRLRPLHDDLVGDASRSLTLLFAIVSLVLLIACGNIVSLLTARLISRDRELGVRQALGAGRRHVLGQLLTEGLLLGALGSVVGILLAQWSSALIGRTVPNHLLHAGGVVVDHRVAVFALVIGVLTGAVCGLLPLFQLRRGDAMKALRVSSQTGAGGPWARRLGHGFAVAQYAFSWATLAVAALLVFSLVELLRVEPGFRTSGWLSHEVILPTDDSSRYADPETLRAYYRRTLDEVASLPEVTGVGLTATLPWDGHQINGLARRSTPGPSGEPRQANPDFRIVDGGYFETLGIALLRGRTFEPSDVAGDPVVVVNQALARELWGDDDPIGQTLVAPGIDPDLAKTPLRVVGIVADTHYRKLESAPRAALYVPWQKTPSRHGILHLVAATTDRGEELGHTVRQRILAQDAALPIGPTTGIEALLRSSTTEPRFRASLLAGFAILALGLALLGVYGMMSTMFSRRQGEMAVRMAMGASRWSIRRLYLKEGVLFIALGQVLGGLALVAGGPLLRGFLHGVEPGHLGLHLAVSLSLAGAVLVACFLPTLRVGRIALTQLMRDS